MSYDDEQSRIVFSAHANKSEDRVNSDEFIDANYNTQRKILEEIANDAAYEFLATYGGDTLQIQTDEYFVVMKDDKGTFISHAEQSDIPMSERAEPMGRLEGCTFIELLLPSPDEKIDYLAQEYPSIVLEDEENGVLILIPIRAFRSARLA